jgi:hypothetical protein
MVCTATSMQCFVYRRQAAVSLTSSALPYGCLMMRLILQMCSAAYLNSTRSRRVLTCSISSKAERSCQNIQHAQPPA